MCGGQSQCKSTKKIFHTHKTEVVITGGRWREKRDFDLTSFMFILVFGIGFIFNYIVGMSGMSRYQKLSNS